MMKAIRILFGVILAGYGIAWAGAFYGLWHADGPDLFFAAWLAFFVAADAFFGKWV